MGEAYVPKLIYYPQRDEFEYVSRDEPTVYRDPLPGGVGITLDLETRMPIGFRISGSMVRAALPAKDEPVAGLIERLRQIADWGSAHLEHTSDTVIEAADALSAAQATIAELRRERDEATQAARDVLAERERQKTAEGWTTEHDDRHNPGDLARAAGCYASHAGDCSAWPSEDYQKAEPSGTDHDAGIYPWPWDREWWKPSNPRRDLVKAGALILAEIERIDRDPDEPTK